MGYFFERILNDELIAGVTIALLLPLAAEVGFRVGIRLFAKHDEARRSQVSAVQGSVLALLGLLLGFTYSMGVARYELRRDMVVKEANAIGTAFLRAGFLPDAHREPVRELLRRYTDVRMSIYEHQSDLPKALGLLKESSTIEKEIWNHTEAAAKEVQTPILATYIVAVNELIDTDAERIAAGRNQIPVAIWGLLWFVAMFGCFTTGWASGAQGARSLFTGIFLPGLIAIVIISVFDLTQGRQGFIQVSQQPMIELRESMR